MEIGIILGLVFLWYELNVIKKALLISVAIQYTLVPKELEPEVEKNVKTALEA